MDACPSFSITAPHAAAFCCLAAPGPPPPDLNPAAAQPSGFWKAIANVRALLFAAWTFTLAVPLFIIMVVMSPVVLLTDKFRWGVLATPWFVFICIGCGSGLSTSLTGDTCK
jgi:hypothetical protein